MKTETIEEEMENYMIQRHFLNQSRKTKSMFVVIFVVRV